ncbi:RNA polymerase sigma factor [Flavobacterium sp.]|uniref:RNA polymerase sigma factor n=1 Tax=Flavobacterium sp. TaxID=239 RepID=UPI00375153E7
MEQNHNFDSLYELYFPKVYRLCKGYFNGNHDVASDAAQEVFIKVWENLPKFRSESNVSTWIFRIASNTCLMYLRKQSSKKEVRTDQFSDSSVENYSQETDEKLSKMYTCIDLLDPTSKLIIMMVLEKVSYDKIATVIGISEETLRVRLHRIKTKLTKCVQNGKI